MNFDIDPKILWFYNFIYQDDPSRVFGRITMIIRIGRIIWFWLVMATCRVRVEFFDTRIRPAGSPLLPKLGRLINGFFFFNPKPSLLSLYGPHLATFGPNPWPNPTQSYYNNKKKKKKKPKHKHKQQHKSINIVISLAEIRFLDRK